MADRVYKKLIGHLRRPLLPPMNKNKHSCVTGQKATTCCHSRYLSQPAVVYFLHASIVWLCIKTDNYQVRLLFAIKLFDSGPVTELGLIFRFLYIRKRTKNMNITCV